MSDEFALPGLELYCSSDECEPSEDEDEYEYLPPTPSEYELVDQDELCSKDEGI